MGDGVLLEQRQRISILTEKLQSEEGVALGLREENVSLKLEREELRAELAFVQARVQRLERSDGSGLLMLKGARCYYLDPCRRGDRGQPG